jgi:Protein of unknown function (DUF4231)
MQEPRQNAKAGDMNDAAEIDEYKNRPELSRLVRVLTCVADQIEPSFRVADQEVGRCKAAYMMFANWAAWLGVLAVFFAILQLSELTTNLIPPVLLPWLEFSLAAAAVIVAAVGLGGRKQQKWFVARHRAEQLRLLKFNFLTRSAVWSPDKRTADNCLDGLAAEVEEVMASSFPALEYWVTRGTVPNVILGPSMSDAEWNELRSYYRKKRLMDQISYLKTATENNLKRNDKTRTWPSVLFFGSVAFVLVHFCIDLAGWRTGGVTDAGVGKAALLLAATLPVCGAGIRVIRGVLEYGRNASRYESTHNVLLELSERLREATNPDSAFREIGFCEQTLEADLREWVRLMVEAEWFG